MLLPLLLLLLLLLLLPLLLLLLLLLVRGTQTCPHTCTQLHAGIHSGG